MSKTVLKPIGRPGGTLADVAYERLSDAMLTGAIAPGARLVMDELAAQLDISRTPVRDALMRLEREGLITPSGRRGYVVRAMTDHDIAHFYQTREAIEGFAARRVAELGPGAIDKVAAVMAEMEATDPDDARQVHDANLTIHRTIVEAVDNPLLLELFDDLWQRARGLMIFADYVARGHGDATAMQPHTTILEALRTGPDAAFRAMRDHIRQGQRAHLG